MNAPDMDEHVRGLYAAAEQEVEARARPQKPQAKNPTHIHKPGFVRVMEWAHVVIALVVWAIAAFRLVVRGAYPPSFGPVDWIFAIGFMVQVWLFFVTDGVWTRIATRRSLAPPPGKTAAPADVFWLTTVWSSFAWPTAGCVPILFWTTPREQLGPETMDAGLAILLLMLIVEGVLRFWVWTRKWFAP